MCGVVLFCVLLCLVTCVCVCLCICYAAALLCWVVLVLSTPYWATMASAGKRYVHMFSMGGPKIMSNQIIAELPWRTDLAH